MPKPTNKPPPKTHQRQKQKPRPKPKQTPVPRTTRRGIRNQVMNRIDRARLGPEVAIADGIALPFDFDFPLVKTDWSNARPIVNTRLFDVINVDQVSQSTSGDGGVVDAAVAGTVVYILQNDPVCPLIYSQQITNNASTYYSLLFSQPGGDVPGPSYTYHSITGEGSHDLSFYLPICHAVPNTSVTPDGAFINGNKWYCRTQEGISGMFFNRGDELELAFTRGGVPATANVSMNFSYWNGSNWEDEFDVLSSGTSSYNTSTNGSLGDGGNMVLSLKAKHWGWAAVHVTVTNLDSTSLPAALSLSGNILLNTLDVVRTFGTVAAHDLQNNESIPYMCNVPAISLLISNMSQELYKNGEVAACQFSSDDNIGSVMDSICTSQNKDWFGLVSSQPGSFTGLAESGVYGYMRPYKEMFDYQQLFKHNSAGQMVSCSSPVKNREWICIVTTTQRILDSGYSANKFKVQLGMTVSYTTRNQWPMARLPDYCLDDLVRAVEALQLMPQFYDNPVHVREILQRAYAAVRAGLSYAPAIAAALSAAQPALRGVPAAARLMGPVARATNKALKLNKLMQNLGL